MVLIPELKVLDYFKSLDFYTRLAEFKILYERQEEDFAMLKMNDAYLMIEGFNEKSRSWLVGKMEKPFGRGINFQIEVPDVQKLYQKFRSFQYPIFFDMEKKRYLANDNEIIHMQFLVQDPDGYLLRFFEKMQQS